VPPNAGEDEQDVLEEAATVSEALRELGHTVYESTFTLDLPKVTADLRALQPEVVFNLVESVEGSGRLLSLAPLLLDFLKIPYTGCPAEAAFCTGNKLIGKQILKAAGIPTPPWLTPSTLAAEASQAESWIVKSVWEHASIGLTENSVVSGESGLAEGLRRAEASAAGESFAEAFIHGREFNISVLGGPDGPEVLPVAELVFVDFPEGRPKIVDYRAKWHEDSFEYEHTVRSFLFPPEDAVLLQQLRDLSLKCWALFRLRGYARVDYRVDDQGNPWVLEVNTNPCISKQAGFMNAARQAGLTPATVVNRIIADSVTQ